MKRLSFIAVALGIVACMATSARASAIINAGSSGSGVTVYPATATASFPYGISGSTVVITSMTVNQLNVATYGPPYSVDPSSIPIHIGDAYTSHEGGGVVVARTLSGTLNDYNGFQVYDVYETNGDNSSAGFSSRGSTAGGFNMRNLIGFESAVLHASTGVLANAYGYYADFTNNGGSTTIVYDYFADDVTGSGYVGPLYGFYVAPLTKGTSRFAFYNAGTAPSYFGGSIAIGTTTPVYPFQVGSATPFPGQNAAVVVSSTIGGPSNARAFADYSVMQAAAGTAYAGFDERVLTAGTSSYDHIAAFQANVGNGSVGTLGKNYSFYSSPAANAGVTSQVFGFYADDTAGAGSVTEQYGVYVATQTKGSTKFPIYVADATNPSFLGGGANMNTKKVTNMGTPTVATDAATKAYVDASTFTQHYFQFASTTSSTGKSTTSSSYVATNLAGTITGVNSAHKVKVSVSADCANANENAANLYLTIKRNGTDLDFTSGQALQQWGGTLTAQLGAGCSFFVVDNTPDSGTNQYIVYIKNSNASTTMTFGTGGTSMTMEEVN